MHSLLCPFSLRSDASGWYPSSSLPPASAEGILTQGRDGEEGVHRLDGLVDPMHHATWLGWNDYKRKISFKTRATVCWWNSVGSSVHLCPISGLARLVLRWDFWTEYMERWRKDSVKMAQVLDSDCQPLPRQVEEVRWTLSSSLFRNGTYAG